MILSEEESDIMTEETIKAYKQMINDLWESVGDKK